MEAYHYGYYSNDFVDCGNDDSLDVDDALTLEAWVKRSADGIGSFPAIISRAQDSSYNRYQLRYKPADEEAQFFLGDSGGYINC